MLFGKVPGQKGKKVAGKEALKHAHDVKRNQQLLSSNQNHGNGINISKNKLWRHFQNKLIQELKENKRQKFCCWAGRSVNNNSEGRRQIMSSGVARGVQEGVAAPLNKFQER